ncbi:MAG: tetratricopeptide repeat protein, partial [Patescibacteria group bacterium]|nr:tetratricopeptide repeat protein [Patescibacteria group bacterium]
ACQSVPQNADSPARLEKKPLKEVTKGDSLTQWGKENSAIEEYLSAITKHPKEIAPYLKLADIYIEMGQFVDALDVYRQGIQQIPGTSELPAGLGQVFFLQNQMELAEQSLLQALEIRRDYTPALTQLAKLYFQIDSLNLAVSFATLAAKSKPKNPELWNELGHYCTLAQEWERGEEAYQKALSLEKENGKTYEMLGDLYYTRSRITHLESQYEKIYLAGPATPQDPMLGEALKWGRRILQKYPHNASTMNNMGVMWWKYGRIDSAIAQFHNALDYDPRFTEARNNLANAYFNKRLYNRSAAEYQRVLMLDSTAIVTLENLGDLYLSQKQNDEAVDVFQRIQHLRKNHPFSLFRLGQLYYRKGKLDSALSLFEKAVTLYAGLQDQMYDSVYARQDSIDLAKALIAYTSAQIQIPHRLSLYEKLMVTAYYLSVLKYFIEKENPSDWNKRILSASCAGLARCYYDSGDIIRATAYFKQALLLGFKGDAELKKKLGLTKTDP